MSSPLSVFDSETSWTVKRRGGEQIVVPATLRNLSTFVFLESEDWFELEMGFVRRLGRPGLRALDIGANLGVYTIALGLRAGSRGHIWVFEPDPAVASRLRRSIDVNRLTNVTLLEVALGSAPGIGRLTNEGGPEFNVVSSSVDGPGVPI